MHGLLAAGFYRTPDTDVRLPGDADPLKRRYVLPAAVDDRWTTLMYGVLFGGGYERMRAERLFARPDAVAREGQRLLARFDAEMAKRARGVDAASISAMAPPSPADTGANPGDGLFCYAVGLAAVYARQPDDGATAAAHVAFLAQDAYQADACARAAFALTAYVLTAPAVDRDAAVRRAAEASGADEVGRALLAARIKSDGMLREEDSPLGRLERVVCVWYRHTPTLKTALPRVGEDALWTVAAPARSTAAPAPTDVRGEARAAADAMLREGLALVADWDARFLLFALTGATFGLDALPPEVQAQYVRRRDLSRLGGEWAALAEDGRMLPVPDHDPLDGKGQARAHRFLVGGRMMFW